jgi:hypothetical protein
VITDNFHFFFIAQGKKAGNLLPAFWILAIYGLKTILIQKSTIGALDGENFPIS